MFVRCQRELEYASYKKHIYLVEIFSEEETKSEKHCEIFSHNILNRNEKYDI